MQRLNNDIGFPWFSAHVPIWLIWFGTWLLLPLTVPPLRHSRHSLVPRRMPLPATVLSPLRMGRQTSKWSSPAVCRWRGDAVDVECSEILFHTMHHSVHMSTYVYRHVLMYVYLYLYFYKYIYRYLSIANIYMYVYIHTVHIHICKFY